MEGKELKKLTALILTFLTLLVLVSCDRSGYGNFYKMALNTTTSEEEKTSEADTIKDNITQFIQNEQWKVDYETFFSDETNYSGSPDYPDFKFQSVYVSDINRDGIPEVFIDYWGMGFPQSVVTYTKDEGIITFEFDDFDSGSSIENKFYIEPNQNIIICTEGGNSPGTAGYHHAVKYSLGTNGFEIMDEISGEEIFEGSTFIKDMNLIDYADVSVTENIKEYLFNELKLNNG